MNRERRIALAVVLVFFGVCAGFGIGYKLGFDQGWQDTWSSVDYLRIENNDLKAKLKELQQR